MIAWIIVALVVALFSALTSFGAFANLKGIRVRRIPHWARTWRDRRPSRRPLTEDEWSWDCQVEEAER